MAFNATLEKTNGIAKITLSGELDASTAPIFQAEVEKAAAENPKRLVLMMQDLSFMASAGVRVLIFATRRMSADVDFYMVGPQEMVLETLKKTGITQSVIVVDEYDAGSENEG